MAERPRSPRVTREGIEEPLERFRYNLVHIQRL